MDVDTTRLRQLAISDSGFAFDPLTGHTFTLNASGLVIIAGIKAGRGVDAIADELREAFESEGLEDHRRDVEDFVLRVREEGLVK